MYIYIYIHVYIERERQRQRQRDSEWVRERESDNIYIYKPGRTECGEPLLTASLQHTVLQPECTITCSAMWLQRERAQRLLRQHLYFCTSNASKLSTCLMLSAGSIYSASGFCVHICTFVLVKQVIEHLTATTLRLGGASAESRARAA